jgi:hypothetical protein
VSHLKMSQGYGRRSKLARRARWPRLGGAATKTFSNSSSIFDPATLS